MCYSLNVVMFLNNIREGMIYIRVIINKINSVSKEEKME